MEDLKRFEPLWDCWYIKQLLGEGGYGKVYRIEREEFGNTYISALKYIRVPQSQSEIKSIMADGMSKESVERYFETFVEDIVKEFVLMSKLKGNSHIVSYEDHKVVKSKDKIEWDLFIRMELLTSLIDYIADNNIRKRDVIQLGIDICKALETCQKYNIIHRDIKPENIFVSQTGQFKLGDFGIARQVEKTISGLSKKGTFTYIAPEVYKGEAYGSTVDIYSLGIVMYRLLNNNRVPFMPPYPNPITHNDRETSLVKRMSGISIEKPVNADGRLAEIVLKACAYKPKDRYENPMIMRKALEAIIYNEEEAAIIYPNGDQAEIKSINYIPTETESKTFTQGNFSEKDATRTMTDAGDFEKAIIDDIRAREEAEKAEEGKKAFPMKKKALFGIGGLAVFGIIAGVIGYSEFSEENEVREVINESEIMETEETAVETTTEETTVTSTTEEVKETVTEVKTEIMTEAIIFSTEQPKAAVSDSGSDDERSDVKNNTSKKNNSGSSAASSKTGSSNKKSGGSSSSGNSNSTPKTEKPKAETPKVETPKAEAPKMEKPKVETPKSEAPKEEASVIKNELPEFLLDYKKD